MYILLHIRRLRDRNKWWASPLVNWSYSWSSILRLFLIMWFIGSWCTRNKWAPFPRAELLYFSNSAAAWVKQKEWAMLFIIPSAHCGNQKKKNPDWPQRRSVMMNVHFAAKFHKQSMNCSFRKRNNSGVKWIFPHSGRTPSIFFLVLFFFCNIWASSASNTIYNTAEGKQHNFQWIILQAQNHTVLSLY